MVARVWTGWTSPVRADSYEALLKTQVLPDIAARGLPGYHGADVCRRTDGDEVEFMTILWFDSIENVEAFTGSDYEVAHVPAAARKLLERFDARSKHYDHVRSREVDLRLDSDAV